MDSSLIKVNFILSLVLIVFAIFFSYKLYYLEKTLEQGLQSQHFYFATTENGRLVRMTPLQEAGLKDKEVKEWVEQSISNLLTFNDQNYRDRLKSSSRSFTKRGWESFTKWLRDSAFLGFTMGIVSGLEQGVLLGVHVDDLTDVKIVEQGLVAGRYQWIVSGTIMLRLNQNKAEMPFHAVVVRSPRLESEFGVGIEEITFDRAKRHDP